jgi:hypothetical protein
MLPKYRDQCNRLSPVALSHLAARFALIPSLPGSSNPGYDTVENLSHAAATLTLLRAGYIHDAELLLGRPITHHPAQPSNPLLLMGSARLLDRLAVALAPEPTQTHPSNTRLRPSARIASATPAAARLGRYTRKRLPPIAPGQTVGALLRYGYPRRSLNQALARGYITLDG